MADLTTQLADLNANAKNLLQKYDGAFSKIENLSEQKQKELSDFVSKQIDFIKKNYGNIDLDAIRKEIEGKASDAIKEIEDKVKNSVVEKAKVAENALKLGGKSLEELGLLKKKPNPSTFDILGDNSAIALYEFNGNANDTGGVYNGITNKIDYVNGVNGQAIKISNKDLDDNTIQFDSGIEEEFVDEFSVSFWFKPLNSFSNRANLSLFISNKELFMNNGDWKHRWDFSFNPSNLTIKQVLFIIDYDNGKKYNLANNEKIELNKWYFVAMSYKNGYKAYSKVIDMDGKIIINRTIDKPNGKVKKGLALGRMDDYYSCVAIDNIRPFNRFITENEIDKIYNIEKDNK